MKLYRKPRFTTNFIQYNSFRKRYKIVYYNSFEKLDLSSISVSLTLKMFRITVIVNSFFLSITVFSNQTLI